MADGRRTVEGAVRRNTVCDSKENTAVGGAAKKVMEQAEPEEIYVQERIEDKETGQVHFKKYLRGKFLGKGGFARCYELKDLTTNQIYAAKVVAKSTLTKSRAMQKLKAEIKIHRSLRHINIVKFEHFFEDDENVYILLEMCNQKSMMELIRRRGHLSELEAKYYLLQVIGATKFMHSSRVIHRDLKLGNLFLNNMQIKIGDFGLAAKLEHDGQRKRTICGTPNYIAPEILEGGSNGHSYEVDVWSLGVILYTLLIGKPPFETKDVKTTYVRIKANMYSFPETPRISDTAKTLVRRILHTLPEARPTIDELLDHPFFTATPVPKLLPNTALYEPFIPAKSPVKSPSKSPFRATAPPSHYRASPSRVPLSERTNTTSGANIPAASTANFAPSVPQLQSNFPSSSGNPTMGSQRPLYQTQSVATATEPAEDSSARKMRRIDKTNENNLHNLFFKSTLAEGSAAEANPSALSTLTSSQSSRTSTQSSPTQPTPQENAENGEEDDNLDMMHKKLVESFLVKGVSEHVHPSALQQPSVWVVKWVDYSNKYGLGYQLSNNIFGAYFNDATKMVVGGNVKQCEYIENVKSSEPGASERKAYLMDPPTPHAHQLSKKITLLKYFKNYLVEQSTVKQADDGTVAPASNLVYVKKWLRTNLAIIFRLSNKIVQVNFFDHTKIILSSEATVITYITPSKQTVTQSLSAIVQNPPSSDLIERLKYIRDILHRMIDHKRSKPPSAK